MNINDPVIYVKTRSLCQKTRSKWIWIFKQKTIQKVETEVS